ncbi:MAG: hypothetical protein CMB99_02050 [Flavobacteriaceae bacterium]|nr:hypothetical protein [Flavobacteriaceae bacterium]|tara:strand:- start:54266 stop:55081 length:816 start_codon:yes stop_codon:yes gene_type:complete
MKKIFLIAFYFSLSLTSLFGQKNEDKTLFITYKITYKLGKELTKEGYLFVHEGTKYFFTSRSYFKEEIKKYSFNEAKNEHAINIMQGENLGEYAYSDFENSLHYATRLKGSRTIKTKESISNITWEKSNDSIVSQKYHCYPYVTSFRGRTYTAHVSDSVKYNYGPWKFHSFKGLPVFIEDSKKQVRWELTNLTYIDRTKTLEYISFIKNRLENLEEMELKNYVERYDQTRGYRHLIDNYPKLPDDFQKEKSKKQITRTGIELEYEWEKGKL